MELLTKIYEHFKAIINISKMSSRSTDQLILAPKSKEVAYHPQGKIKKKHFKFHVFYWDFITLIGALRGKKYLFNQKYSMSHHLFQFFVFFFFGIILAFLHIDLMHLG